METTEVNVRNTFGFAFQWRDVITDVNKVTSVINVLSGLDPRLINTHLIAEDLSINSSKILQIKFEWVDVFIYFTPSKQYHPYRWPETILHPSIVYGSEFTRDKNFDTSRQFIAYKDAVGKYSYDQKTRQSVLYCYLPTSVTRNSDTWSVQTKYLKIYVFKEIIFMQLCCTSPWLVTIYIT